MLTKKHVLVLTNIITLKNGHPNKNVQTFFHTNKIANR